MKRSLPGPFTLSLGKEFANFQVWEIATVLKVKACNKLHVAKFPGSTDLANDLVSLSGSNEATTLSLTRCAYAIDGNKSSFSWSNSTLRKFYCDKIKISSISWVFMIFLSSWSCWSRLRLVSVSINFVGFMTWFEN